MWPFTWRCGPASLRALHVLTRLAPSSHRLRTGGFLCFSHRLGKRPPLLSLNLKGVKMEKQRVAWLRSQAWSRVCLTPALLVRRWPPLPRHAGARIARDKTDCQQPDEKDAERPFQTLLGPLTPTREVIQGLRPSSRSPLSLLLHVLPLLLLFPGPEDAAEAPARTPCRVPMCPRPTGSPQACGCHEPDPPAALSSLSSFCHPPRFGFGGPQTPKARYITSWLAFLFSFFFPN